MPKTSSVQRMPGTGILLASSWRCVCCKSRKYNHKSQHGARKISDNFFRQPSARTVFLSEKYPRNRPTTRLRPATIKREKSPLYVNAVFTTRKCRVYAVQMPCLRSANAVFAQCKCRICTRAPKRLRKRRRSQKRGCRRMHQPRMRFRKNGNHKIRYRKYRIFNRQAQTISRVNSTFNICES